MSDCTHTIYKDGKPVLTETMPNKGLDFEHSMGICIPDDTENKSKDIWTARREMGDNYCH